MVVLSTRFLCLETFLYQSNNRAKSLLFFSLSLSESVVPPSTLTPTRVYDIFPPNAESSISTFHLISSAGFQKC
ncbi:hypothetical protein VNO80_15391 [Phaseolus coccineus]|uniref:Uncharacterized protein n=1 Tax=Phaseolus coccineus TaxID=3886 RepID=A0AAN9MK75_PHACN